MIRVVPKAALVNAVTAAVLSALVLCCRPCLGFGEKGHRGVYSQALVLLRATDRNVCAVPWQGGWGQGLDACIYPDTAVTFPQLRDALPRSGEITITVLGKEYRIPVDFDLAVEYFPGSLNSSDHYFDPGSPSTVAAMGVGSRPTEFVKSFAAALAESLVVRSDPLRLLPDDARRKAIELLAQAIEGLLSQDPRLFAGKARTYEEYLRNAPGTIDCPASDGDGYNALTAILFLLNGRDDNADANSNPSGAGPTKGFIALARSGQARDLDDAATALGAAIHYVADLFSPGHTAWGSWTTDLTKLADGKPSHSDYDGAGDDFLGTLTGLPEAKPRLVLSFADVSKVCTTRGKKNLVPPEDTDLTTALKAEALKSRRLWDTRSPVGFPSQDLLKHMGIDSVEVAAGVIDWAFSRAVPNDKKDGPYPRDATNFLGMAVALPSSPDATGAVLTPEALQGKDCYLGGVDRDDYFPIAGAQISRVSVAVKEGPQEAVKAEVFDPTGAPIPATVQLGTGTIDLRLGKAVDKFILRVYSPDGTAATYAIGFPPADVEMIVEAEAAVVKRGKQIKFTGKVVDKAGKPVAGVTVGVEDPLAEKTLVLPVQPDGSFSHACDTFLTKPGVYTFVFLSTRTPEQVHAIAVIDEGYRTVSLPRFQVPLGNWGTIAESFGKRPEVFTSVTRTTSGQSPPAILSPPYAPPSETSQMVAAARTLAEDIVAGSVEEFTSSPVTAGAVGVAVATCPFPDVTVTKAACAASVAYLESAAVEAVTKTVFKKAVDLSDLSAPEKEFWKQRADEAFLVYDVLQLDPKAGPRTAKGVEQTLNMLAVQWDATQVIFKNIPTQSPGGTPSASGYAVIPLASGEVLAIAARGAQPPSDKGMLDVVFCIDTTGSMADDIEEVKKASGEILAQLKQYCADSKISLQVGLVTYQDHTDAQQFKGTPQEAWLVARPLTPQSETIRQNILAIPTPKPAVGGDAEEDAYAAYMCAMDARPDWQGKTLKMGWREGAAKILIPMCDAPPHDPDFEGRTLKMVSDRADELDPVHVYPLMLPKPGLGFLDPTVRALERIADATGGKVIRVSDASALPQALVDTVKLAIRRHRNEVWRKENPPYLLYGAIAGLLGVMALTTVGLILWSALGGKKPASPQTPVIR